MLHMTLKELIDQYQEDLNDPVSTLIVKKSVKLKSLYQLE